MDLHNRHLLPQDKHHVRGILASGLTMATFHFKERSPVQADQNACLTNNKSQSQTEVNGQLHVLAGFLTAKDSLAPRLVAP